MRGLAADALQGGQLLNFVLVHAAVGSDLAPAAEFGFHRLPRVVHLCLEVGARDCVAAVTVHRLAHRLTPTRRPALAAGRRLGLGALADRVPQLEFSVVGELVPVDFVGPVGVDEEPGEELPLVDDVRVGEIGDGLAVGVERRLRVLGVAHASTSSVCIAIS